MTTQLPLFTGAEPPITMLSRNEALAQFEQLKQTIAALPDSPRPSPLTLPDVNHVSMERFHQLCRRLRSCQRRRVVLLGLTDSVDNTNARIRLEVVIAKLTQQLADAA